MRPETPAEAAEAVGIALVLPSGSDASSAVMQIQSALSSSLSREETCGPPPQYRVLGDRSDRPGP